MADYVDSVMPGLCLDDPAEACGRMREYGEERGITIGG